jgi:hypothetical protein
VSWKHGKAREAWESKQRQSLFVWEAAEKPKINKLLAQQSAGHITVIEVLPVVSI